MKIKSTTIPVDSLVNKYLPADYSDVFIRETISDLSSTPDDIAIRFFTDMPEWVNALFKLRNLMVRFVGLKRGDKNVEKLKECIRTGGKHELL